LLRSRNRQADWWRYLERHTHERRVDDAMR
jgi:hypothetical protein